MKRFIVVGLILAAASLVWAFSPQGAPATVIVYAVDLSTGRVTWLRLGPTLSISNGQIDAVLPPVRARRYRVRLAYDATARGWKLPAGVANVAIYVNGVGYDSEDFTVTGDLVTAKFPNSMLPEHKVTADFDQ